MSISNRMYDRLCKLYHLVLVRMRTLEAARAFPQFRLLTLSSLNRHHARGLEPLEPRVLLSGAPVLPGMQLANDDITNWQGQIVFLDFDGAQDITYDGPVAVGPFDVPAYQAPLSLAGQEADIQNEVLSNLQATFAGTGITFTLLEPGEGTDYSTVYVGGDDTAFHTHGRFTGLVEVVDAGNQNPADYAIVFSKGLASTTQLNQVVVHEVGHLLGYAHDTATNDQNALSEVAENTFTILPGPAYVNQDDGGLTFTISRSDISTTQTMYVTTVQDQGDINSGHYVDLDHQAITFEQGRNTATISIIINDLGLTTGSQTFRLILQASPDEPQSPELATSNFTIVNNASMTDGESIQLGIDTHDTGIVAYASELYASRYRFVGMYLGQDSNYLTADDAAQIQAAGLKVFSIYQQEGMTDTDANGDHTYEWQTYFTQAQGEADAADAYIAATQHALQPFGSAIYFSIELNPADTDGITQQEALDRISDYFLGIQTYFSTLPADSLYTIGVMGAGDTLTQVINDGLAQHSWLAVSQDWAGYSDWEYSSVLPRAWNVLQTRENAPQARFGNILFNSDTNRVLPLGAWNESAAPQISVDDVSLTFTDALYPNIEDQVKSLRVTSLYLTPGDTVKVTAPTGFEIALKGSSEYSQNLVLTPTHGYISELVNIRVNESVSTDISGQLTIASNLDSSLTKTVYLASTLWGGIDNTPPAVEAFDVSYSPDDSQNTVTITYTVSDAGGAGLLSALVYRAPDAGGVPGSFQYVNTKLLSNLSLPNDGPYSDVYTETPDVGTWWYKVVVHDKRGIPNLDGEGASAPIAVTVVDKTPAVSSVSPAIGSTLGGTQVIITGRFFDDASAVYFGNQEATSFTIDSDTQITAITPASSTTVEVDVTVTTPNGTSPVLAANTFIYRLPSRNLVSYQPEGWSDKLVLSHQTGTSTDDPELFNNSNIYMDWSVANTGELATNASFRVDLYWDGSYIKKLATIPSVAGEDFIVFEDYNLGYLSAGTHTLQIVIDYYNTVSESNESDNTYTKTITIGMPDDDIAPTINAFDVTSNVVAPYSNVSLPYSVSDDGGAGVKYVALYRAPDVGGVPGRYDWIQQLWITEDERITGTLTDYRNTTGTWWYDLRVIDYSNNSTYSSDVGLGPIAVTVQNAPTLAGISPAGGDITGGESVVITGTDFLNATAVHFGNIEASSFTIDSATQITAIAPVSPDEGVVDVTVTTPVGTTAITPAGQFTYIELLPELLPHQPAGWTDEMVISSQAGTYTQPEVFFDTDDLYLDWSIINDGDAATQSSFVTSLYINDVLKEEWQTSSLMQIDDVFSIEDYALGSLSAGSYTLKIVIDSNNTVDEYDDALNNVYTKTINVTLAPAPYSVSFDFGTSSSPLQAGATRVTESTSYNSSRGYGWQTSGIASRDRGSSGGATSLNRDLNATADGTFAVDLADGFYDVTVYLGDKGYQHDQMGIYLEDEFKESLTAAAGQIVSRTYSVSVTDGQLTLRLKDLGGIDPSVSIVGLDIVSSGPPVNHAPSVANASKSLLKGTSLLFTPSDFTAAFTDPNSGDSLQKIKITTLPAQGEIKLNGVAVTADQEISLNQLAGLIYTPDSEYAGSDSFKWIASDGQVYATTSATFSLTINAPAAYDKTFDFGTSSSPLQAGTTKVTESTSYNSSRGYGWQTTGIASRDRGTSSGATSLNRDLNATADGTFAVDLADGFYDVTVHLGDKGYQHDQMGVYLENSFQESVTAAAGQIATRTYSVSVTDGQLTLRLKDLGGIDPSVSIVGLRIVSSGPPVNYAPAVSHVALSLAQDTTLTFAPGNFTAAFSDPNAGDTLQWIKILTLPGQGELKLNGIAVTPNQEITLGQAASLTYTPLPGYSGSQSFEWIGSDGQEYAASSAMVNLTITPPAAYSVTFDFGTSSSPLQAGATRVTESTSYNSSRGYGWQTSGIASRDRGSSSGATSLNRDLNATADGTFAVDLADGPYNVTVYLGDKAYQHDQMGVYLENAFQESVSAAAGQVVSRTYSVLVADGQLTLRLKDLGGIDPSISIVGLEITQNL